MVVDWMVQVLFFYCVLVLIVGWYWWMESLDMVLYDNSYVNSTLDIYLFWQGCWGGESLLRLYEDGG